eukprot:1556619-Rhodomonas_salina.6
MRYRPARLTLRLGHVTTPAWPSHSTRYSHADATCAIPVYPAGSPTSVVRNRGSPSQCDSIAPVNPVSFGHLSSHNVDIVPHIPKHGSRDGPSRHCDINPSSYKSKASIWSLDIAARTNAEPGCLHARSSTVGNGCSNPSAPTSARAGMTLNAPSVTVWCQPPFFLAQGRSIHSLTDGEASLTPFRPNKKTRHRPGRDGVVGLGEDAEASDSEDIEGVRDPRHAFAMHDLCVLRADHRASDPLAQGQVHRRCFQRKPDLVPRKQRVRVQRDTNSIKHNLPVPAFDASDPVSARHAVDMRLEGQRGAGERPGEAERVEAHVERVVQQHRVVVLVADLEHCSTPP